jgi:hypothetical protein
VLFWFYTLLLVIYIYMRNFTNLCIMVWIHMDAHEYVYFFQNLNILCIFSDWFFSGSGFLGRPVQRHVRL